MFEVLMCNCLSVGSTGPVLYAQHMSGSSHLPSRGCFSLEPDLLSFPAPGVLALAPFES